MISLATSSDFGASVDLNVTAYREFATLMSPEGWRGMEKSLRVVEARAQSTQFLVMREQGAIVGSVGYCPAGKGNPEFFPPDWAGVLHLAVSPTHRGRGIARELVSTCIQYAQDDSAEVIGLFTSELPIRLGLRYWRYKLPLTRPRTSVRDEA